MTKIKVVHHSKYIGYSGTDRTAQVFCEYLNKSDKYEAFLVYRRGMNDERLNIMKSILGEDHVVPYEWIPGKKGQHPPYLPEHDTFFEVIESINPAIVHHHFSGYNEHPVFKYLSPKAKVVTTNIFGYSDVARQADLTIYISDYIRNRALAAGGVDGPVLYNPIEQPPWSMIPGLKIDCKEWLLNRVKLPKNSILLGRIGRADNFDPISLKAFKEVEQACPEAYYLVVNPCQGWRDWVKSLGIKNVRFLDPIIDDDDLWKWYLGLDIYAHARHDGDCCPVSIQQAMMAGVPSVSHESAIYNGQAEIIANAGFVVPIGDHIAYRDVLMELIANREFVNEDETGLVRLRDYFGLEARRRAMRHFEASCITSQLERLYDGVLSNGK